MPRDAAFGTIDSWLVFKLTGEHATDFSNASRTLLFDIRERRWDPELCDLLGVDPGSLPEPRPSAHVYGETSSSAARSRWPASRATSRRRSTAGLPRAGLGKNTYGTGSFVLENAGRICRSRRRAPHHRRLGSGRPRGLRARGRDLRHRRRGAVAARPARDHPHRRRDRGAGPLARLERRRLPRAGLHGARLAALGPVRARDARPASPAAPAAPPGAAALEAMAYQAVDAVRAMERRPAWSSRS